VPLDKSLLWLGSSREDLRAFPPEARQRAGFQLRRVQRGLEPDDWKPMAVIGAGVREIRIHIGGEHRVFYVATFAESVYVLHAFRKKTQRTARRDIDVGRGRFRDLIAWRQTHGNTRND
jgi:phage-related protein